MSIEVLSHGGCQNQNNRERFWHTAVFRSTLTVLSKVLVALLCLAVTAHRREWWHGPVGEKGVIVRQLPTDFPSGRTRGVEAVRLAFEI